jgi:hypothetical protein
MTQDTASSSPAKIPDNEGFKTGRSAGNSSGRLRRQPTPGRREAVILRDVSCSTCRTFGLDHTMALRWTTLGDPLSRAGTTLLEAAFMVGDQAVGVMVMREFRPPHSLEAEALQAWMAMKDRHHGREICALLTSCWQHGDVLDRGGVVHFSRLWLEPDHARGSAWAPLVNAFLAHRHLRSGPHRAALLLLRPFPLEYEGAFHEDDGVPLTALRQRQAAMARLYGHHLGVRMCPGEEGWMWKPLCRGLPEPNLHLTPCTAGMPVR